MKRVFDLFKIIETFNNSRRRKNSKMDSESKTGSSDVKAPDNKQSCHPITSPTVMEAIKSLNMSNCAPESKTGSRAMKAPEKKQPWHRITSKRIMETIKSLNMNNGAPLEAIKAFIGEHYYINENTISARIQRSLKNSVEKGLLEQVADGSCMRFKLKDTTGQEIKTKPQVKEIPKKNLKKNHSASDCMAKSTPKRNISTPSLPQMVVESIKSLKMRNGAPVEAILRCMEEHYGVNVKIVTPNLKRFLKTGVQRGVLDKTSKPGADERFKVTKMAEVRIRKALKA